uniref:Uncharacterized protein n=1 Tax=Salvator merianae TaxID=96440 RepID=A0A8D0ED72_SALMN
MSLKRLIQQNRNANYVGYCVSSAYTPCLEPTDSPTMDNKRILTLANSLGTLTRNCRQVSFTSEHSGMCQMNSTFVLLQFH